LDEIEVIRKCQAEVRVAFKTFYQLYAQKALQGEWNKLDLSKTQCTTSFEFF